jgi:hypothetical protein
MSYTRAKLIVWNHAAYEAKQVREAAIFIMGRIGAHDEDVSQAIMLAAGLK